MHSQNEMYSFILSIPQRVRDRWLTSRGQQAVHCCPSLQSCLSHLFRSTRYVDIAGRSELGSDLVSCILYTKAVALPCALARLSCSIQFS